MCPRPLGLLSDALGMRPFAQDCCPCGMSVRTLSFEWYFVATPCGLPPLDLFHLPTPPRAHPFRPSHPSASPTFPSPRPSAVSPLCRFALPRPSLPNPPPVIAWRRARMLSEENIARRAGHFQTGSLSRETLGGGGGRAAQSGEPGKHDRRRGRSKSEEEREEIKKQGLAKGEGREARFPVRGTEGAVTKMRGGGTWPSPEGRASMTGIGNDAKEKRREEECVGGKRRC